MPQTNLYILENLLTQLAEYKAMTNKAANTIYLGVHERTYIAAQTKYMMTEGNKLASVTLLGCEVIFVSKHNHLDVSYVPLLPK